MTNAIAIALISACIAGTQYAHAQADRVRIIGSLSLSAEPGAREKELRDGLRELGWIEGKNLRIEFRYAANQGERLPLLARELIAANAELIVAWSTPVIQALKTTTATLPIVMGSAADPVGTGFIASLARPGGNVTGTSLMMPELAGKRLELLREVVPGLSRVGYLLYAGDSAHKLFLKEAEEAGRRAGVRIQPLIVARTDEISGMFPAMKRERAEALIVQPLFSNTLGQGPVIAELAVANRMPTISDGQGFLEAGGFMYFGPDLAAVYRRSASYVDRILKGAKPAGLPVEQPQRFELVINLKTAKRLGVDVPQGILVRADRVER